MPARLPIAPGPPSSPGQAPPVRPWVFAPPSGSRTEKDGGEGGIGTVRGRSLCASYRIHVTNGAAFAAVPVAPCTILHHRRCLRLILCAAHRCREVVIDVVFDLRCAGFNPVECPKRLKLSTPKLDDLEAVRTVVAAVQDFKPEEQQRIFRWAAEKLGISVPPPSSYTPPPH